MRQMRRQQLSLGEKELITNVFFFPPANLNLERKGRCEILPSFLDQALQDKAGRADSATNSHP